MRKQHVAVAGVLGPMLVVLALLSMGQSVPPGFGDPLPGATTVEIARFQAGLTAFENAEDVADGLGPVFNENACAACHNVGATGGGGARLETRFGHVAGGVFDPMADLGGSLIQDHGVGLVGGFNFVGEVVPPTANVVASRRTTPLFGLGLVDNVPDALLMEVAELELTHTPTTAGRANVITDAASGQQRVGRFGWKCQQASLFTFSGDAYLNEMGVTTPLFPAENCPQGNCALLTNTGLPLAPNDADNSTLVKFTDFMTFLAAPPRGAITQTVQKGAAVFAQIGCANCHLPALKTGPNPSTALSNVTFFPFSDFLLHDMGSLGDGIVQGSAGATELRTAPLWGCRLFSTFLHDGRATTVTGAILAHDGQGRAARDRFTGLSSTQRAQLLAFLGSL